jgi:hypothetical protein
MKAVETISVISGGTVIKNFEKHFKIWGNLLDELSQISCNCGSACYAEL